MIPVRIRGIRQEVDQQIQMKYQVFDFFFHYYRSLHSANITVLTHYHDNLKW